MNNNQTLWINEASDDFEGRYTCYAINKVDQISRDFIVKLTGTKSFSRRLNNFLKKYAI